MELIEIPANDGVVAGVSKHHCLQTTVRVFHSQDRYIVINRCFPVAVPASIARGCLSTPIHRETATGSPELKPGRRQFIDRPSDQTHELVLQTPCIFVHMRPLFLGHGRIGRGQVAAYHRPGVGVRRVQQDRLSRKLVEPPGLAGDPLCHIARKPKHVGRDQHDPLAALVFESQCLGVKLLGGAGV